MKIVLVLLLFLAVPAAWGQLGDQDITVIIGPSGGAHVIHILEKSADARYLQPIHGEISNLRVGNSGDGEAQYADGVILVPPTGDDIGVEYDIVDAMAVVDGVWTWEVTYSNTIIFYIPESPDTVYANGAPVYVEGRGGIQCHGCQIKLEYIPQEPIGTYPVSWEEHEFDVMVRSLDTPESISFHQPSMSMSLDGVGGSFVTVIMPVDLLGGPYHVYQGEDELQAFQYRENGTHAWINVRPQESGILTLVGTTVIPEFSAAALVMAAASVPALAGVIRRRLHTRRNRTRLSSSRTGDTLWYS